MTEKLNKWKCYICGEDVIEGQKFTFTKDGAVHIHCLEKHLTKKHKQDPEKLLKIERLIRALDLSSSGIVGYKQLKLAEDDEKQRKFYEKLQIEEEKISTLITKEIEKYL